MTLTDRPDLVLPAMSNQAREMVSRQLPELFKRANMQGANSVENIVQSLHQAAAFSDRFDKDYGTQSRPGYLSIEEAKHWVDGTNAYLNEYKYDDALQFGKLEKSVAAAGEALMSAREKTLIETQLGCRVGSK